MQTSETSTKRAQASGRRKPLLLVAEYNESDYQLLEMTLRREFELLWARDGLQAVEYALTQGPDAVLLDIDLPGYDGIRTLREIRRHTADLPVVIQSRSAFNTDRKLAEEAGCDGFITKPVITRKLQACLSHCTARPAAE